MKTKIIILFLLLAVQGIAQQQWWEVATQGGSLDLTYGLVSAWEMEETSGSTAYDANENYDGTITGATLNQTGKLSRAFDYSVNDHISFSYSAVPDEADRSFSVWFKLDDTSSDHVLLTTWSNGLAYSGQFLFMFDASSSKTGLSNRINYIVMTANQAASGV